MFFTASKLLDLLANPACLIAAGALVTAVLAWTRWRRLMRAIAGLTALLALIAIVLPTGSWLLEPLESRFPPAAIDTRPVAGVLLLGGAIDVPRSLAANRLMLAGDADRMLTFLALARRLPAARLAFSGGTGSLADRQHKEADFVPGFLSENGIDPARLTNERESRNTRENAALAFQTVRPQPGERWLLVTAAWHMPRAIGCFRAVGWQIEPFPSGPFADMTATGWSPLRNLARFNTAVREWMGLFAYRVQGYTESLIPAPF